MREVHWAIIFVYIVIGVYMINLTLKLLQLPQQLSGFGDWIVFLSGVLLIVAAVGYGYNRMGGCYRQ